MNTSSTHRNNTNNGSTMVSENVTGTTTEDYEYQWLQDNFNLAQYAICPLLFLLGITGNLMTVLTVTKPQFRQLTSRYILCALAISDSLLLWTNPFNQQFMLAFLKTDVRALTREGCKIFFVVYRTGKMSSSWCVVLVAMERFMAVWFPLQVKRVVTKRNIFIAISFVCAAMLSLSSAWVFSTEVVDGVCRPDAITTDNLLLHKRFLVAGAVCYSIAPIAILLTFTPPIIGRLVQHLQRQRDLQSNTVSRFARETNRTTIMLIAIVLVYIVCVTPITLVLVLTFWTNEPIFGSHKKEFIILTSVAQSFEQINHSSNFAVYVLCSSQFRRGFMKMIGCRRRSLRNTMTRSSSQVYKPSKTRIQEISSVIENGHGNLA